MKYNEEIADRLKRKYNFAPSTIRDWKYRDHIPDRYSDPNYKLPQKASAKQLAEFDQLWTLDYITLKHIDGIAYYRFSEYKSGSKNVSINKKDIQMATHAMQKIKTAIKKYLKKPSEEALEELLELPIIRKQNLVNNDKLYWRFVKGLYYIFSEEEIAYLKQRLKSVVEDLPFC